jgi:hypothetical protein
MAQRSDSVTEADLRSISTPSTQNDSFAWLVSPNGIAEMAEPNHADGEYWPDLQDGLE